MLLHRAAAVVENPADKNTWVVVLAVLKHYKTLVQLPVPISNAGWFMTNGRGPINGAWQLL